MTTETRYEAAAVTIKFHDSRNVEAIVINVDNAVKATPNADASTV